MNGSGPAQPDERAAVREAEAALARQDPPPSEDEICRLLAASNRWTAAARRLLLERVGSAVAERAGPVSAELERAVALGLSDPDAEVRAEAAACLALLPVDRSNGAHRRASLIARLDDPSPGVRAAAAAALGDLSAGTAGDELDPVRAPLRGRLADDDAEVRFEAAFALASAKDPAARPVLESALSSRRHRLDALEALGRLGDSAALPAIGGAAKGWWLGWVDRTAAWTAQLRCGDPEAASRLIERLERGRAEERIHVAATLGRLRVAEARPALRQLAESGSARSREAAVEALRQLAHPADAELLRRVGGDSVHPCRGGGMS